MITAKQLEKDVMERFGFKVLTIRNVWYKGLQEPVIEFYEVEIEYSDKGYSKVLIPYEDHSWNNSVDMVMWFQEKAYNQVYGLNCSICGRGLTADEHLEAFLNDVTECECGGGLVEI